MVCTNLFGRVIQCLSWGLATTGKTSADFEFCFRAFHKYDLEWNPSILLADTSNAITAGFEIAFWAPLTCITCFFHVSKNINTRAQGFTKSKKHGKLFSVAIPEHDA